MKIYCITLFNMTKGAPTVLADARDLSSFGYFQRGSVDEFMTFFGQTLAERTDEGTRQSVKEKTYVCHVHNRQDKIAGLVVTDEEYPSRVAFTLISKVVDDFKQAHPISAWTADAR